MKLARVVGTVVSTIQYPSFDGRTLLLCDFLDPSGKTGAGYTIAVDSVGAGAGETVLLLDEGTGARQVLRAPGAPIRTVVVGIVDRSGGAGARPSRRRRAAGRRRRAGAAEGATDADHVRRPGVLARWQPILRLADWDIDLRLVTGEWRKSGDIKIDLDDRKAVLLLNAEPRSENLEEVIVHELVHLRLYAMDQMLVELLDAVFGTDAEEPRRAFAETRFMGLLESTTEDLAKALLAAAGVTAPLSFGRLRREVEEEVGPGATATGAGSA